MPFFLLKKAWILYLFVNLYKFLGSTSPTCISGSELFDLPYLRIHGRIHDGPKR